MKKLLFLFTLLIVGLTTWAQPTIVDPGTQVTTQVCYGQYEIVLEDIVVYEPNIQSNFSYANVSFLDFTQGTYSFPHPDTMYINMNYIGTQGSGNISTDISFTTSLGTSDTITGISVNVNTLPTVVFNTGSVGTFCTSDDPIDLSPYATPPGGTFSFTSGTNDSVYMVTSSGIFDPSLTNSNVVNNPIRYTYTDPGTGCSNTDYFDWYNYVLTTPNLTVVPTNATDCSSSDGQISVTPDGNTPNYIISIPNGDTITSTNFVAASFTNLSPGPYYISIQDDSGCVNNAYTHVESGDLSISGVVTDVSCPGASDGSIDITVNASGNYTLYWEHGAFYEDYNNAPAGTYTVYVTDDNGCQVSKSFTINSPSLTFNNSAFYVNNYDCYYPGGQYPGEIYAAAIGTGPLTYTMPSGGTMVNDSTYTDYDPGDYTVVVTDANGCSIDTTVTVGTYNYNEAYLNSVTHADCGMSNGAIDINLYSYEPDSIVSASWSNGATTEDLTNLSPGTYTYTITQVNPVCNFSLDVVVSANEPLQNDICLVTVDSITTTNVVVWEREQTTGIDHYNIYRKSNNSGQFQKIDYVLASEESMFNDVWASPLVKSWEYRISAVNNCGIEGPLSNIHKTIHMTKTDLGNGDYKVEWNKYQGFSYTSHDIWRFTASTGWQMIQSVSNNQTSFTDTPPNTNGLDYSIEVDPGYVCQSTKATSHNASRSNRSSGIFNPGEGTGASNNSIVENESFNVSLYPNPSNTVATLQFDLNQKYNVTIYNMNGQVIESLQFTGNRLDINTSSLSNGLYIVDIQNNKNKFTEKLVVQH